MTSKPPHPRRPARMLPVLVVCALAAAIIAMAQTLPPQSAHAGVGSSVGLIRSGCGVERWDVKTLADRAGVNLALGATGTVTTIANLTQLPVRTGADGSRGLGTERTEFTLRHVILKEAKLEADSDIHLVVADPVSAKTMIVEFPAPSCLPTTSSSRTAAQNAHSSRDRTLISAARSAFVAACGMPSSSHFNHVPTSSRGTVSGVGFFDFDHGQTGIAKPNAIELHPVLGFTGHC